MNQLALPLDWPTDEREDQFILSSANEAVVQHLDHCALWPVMATILTGPRKSGRSLIGRLFAAKTRGQLIDDGETRDEEEIFHAWNRAQARRRPLLIVADALPPAWAIGLPDLGSRLAATPRVAILPPDDALIAALLQKLLGARGLIVPTGLISYLLPRIERSYVAIQRVIETLDQGALAQRRRLTVPLARDALIEAGVIDAS